MDRSIPLVTVNEDNAFVLNDEATSRLAELQLPIAVVSVVGLYRTGKSYLLNLLKSHPDKLPEPGTAGFEVGRTVNACTKGIWLWGEPVELDDEDGRKVAVIFLDTEGLGSVDSSATHDCRIFALALLLGSSFVYNSRGVIDGNAIENLSLVVNLTKHIHVRKVAGEEEDSGKEFQEFFPSFLWVVRDFTLQLKSAGAGGKPISARKYLEKALKPQGGHSEEAFAKNKIRMMVNSFFKEKDCVTLVRPVADEEKLRDLGSVPWDELREEFRSGVSGLRKKLYSNIRPKQLYGRTLDGAMFVELAHSYVNAINAGGVPTISTAWDRVVKGRCRNAQQLALEAYDAVLAKRERITDEATLFDLHLEGSRTSKSVFAERIGGNGGVDDSMRTLVEEHSAEMERQIEERLVRARSSNRRASTEFCSTLIKKIDREESAKVREEEAGKRDRLSGSSSGAPVAPTASSKPALSPAVQAQLDQIRKLKAERANLGGAGGAPGAKDLGSMASPTSTIRREKAIVERVLVRYDSEARGPGKYAALDKYVSKEILPRMLKGAEAVAAGQRDRIRDMRKDVMSKSNEVTNALTKLKAVREQLNEEKKKSKENLARAESRAELEKGALKDTHAANMSEMKTKIEGLEELISSYKAQALRFETDLRDSKLRATETTDETRRLEREYMDRERKWHAEERQLLEKAQKATFELESMKREKDAKEAAREREVQMEIQSLKEKQRSALQQSEKRRQEEVEKLEAQLEDLRKSGGGGAGGGLDAASEAEMEELQNQLEQSRQESSIMQEHVELLTDHLSVTKDLLAAKTEEVNECEYQWAAAKAKLAQCESDKMDRESEISVLQPLVSALKRALSESGGLETALRDLDDSQRSRLGQL